ncbi:hypothetical protein SERLADRAFT_413658 [Serpula lacrymans var. lacrymans S7.9]|uniref:sn-1-specific diacylglycerol lipase n=1 Tax=Serpula lacrymans var. lacrymans (strain S7.9) TaxID=578457 RepID=F8NP53_SERL9|nr:uncharacterized protein SERLADRAFT_413658 [Serpula lacrymans var. lacrymans S7.9]EGO27137.1 hypothetical protein SERLADRAFT_413658 [Serpula lacrymans var. lacrymans S7.9]
MGCDWETFGRRGLDVASAFSSIGFTAAKSSTRLGFSVARTIASSIVGLTATTVDHTLFGGSMVTSPVLEGAMSTAINFAENLTLAPIFLGEYITSASFSAAHSSIDILSIIFPGSSEASFSLASFITLVKREWDYPAFGTNLPDKRYGVTEVAKALVAWISLQGVTQEWQEKQWFSHLREIEVKGSSAESRLKRVPSRVRVTSDVIFPGHIGQLISADIGEAPASPYGRARSSSTLSRARFSISSICSSQGKDAWKDTCFDVPQKTISEVKSDLRRFSKMVLAGYGGASLLFFGISSDFTSPFKAAARPSNLSEKDVEEAQLESAINASEAEAVGGGAAPSTSSYLENSNYSWWDILMGKHDKEIFERSIHDSQAGVQAKIRATAVVGIEPHMPRFWVLTDHGRQQVVLVLRGTMSLNELAVDLTCEPTTFEPATTLHHDHDERLPGTPAKTSRRRASQQSLSSNSPPHYQVHSGMLRMARVMGEVGKPVHLAVMDALIRYPDYELILCGHSLGAGVATLLGLMWADPTTCRTVYSSGLPVDRPVAVYAFAPPCFTDAALSRLAKKLVTSFVYSDDVVSRLSLGSVRDIRNAALSLCDANERTGGTEGYTVVTRAARRWKAGLGSPDDPKWFLAVRKTLEANMHMADLFPPGRVLWAIRDIDLHPSHRLSPKGSKKEPDKPRLFEVLDVEKIYSQIVFSRNMLSAHLPHLYDRVLHELL